MIKTIDISAPGAPQARIRNMLSAYPLPDNVGRYPLQTGQFYGQIATNSRICDSRADGKPDQG